MSFRLKTILGIAAIELALLAVLILSGDYYLRTSTTSEIANRANSTAQLLATMTADAVVANDLATLEAVVNQTTTFDDLVYIRIRDDDGRVLVEGGNVNVAPQSFSEQSNLSQTGQRFDVVRPVTIGGRPFGTIELGLSSEGVARVIASARGWMVSIASVEIVLVAIFGGILGTMLTRQLSLLRDAAQQVAGGEFGRVIERRSRDEIGATIESFNRMSVALKSYADDLEQARRQAEEKRDLAESILHEAIEAMPSAVLVSSADGRMLHVNAAFRDYHRLSPEELMSGHELAQVLARIDRPTGPQRAGLLYGKQKPFEQNIADGRTVLVSGSQMARSGGFVCIETDITERRRAQAIVTRNAQLIALGEMATGLAHELNQPLNIIRLASLNLASQLSSEPSLAPNLASSVADKVARIGRNIDRAANIIEHMKIFGRGDSGPNTSLRLHEAAEDALQIVGAELRNSGIEIVTKFDAKSPAVDGKPLAVEQVIINLMFNARDAILARRAAGGRDRGDRITLATASGEGMGTLSIEDTGGGIPPDIQSRIFEPFFTTKPAGQGTGLGLSTSFGIMKDLGGELTVVNAAQGARFELRLPLADADKGSIGAAPKPGPSKENL